MTDLAEAQGVCSSDVLLQTAVHNPARIIKYRGEAHESVAQTERDIQKEKI